MKILNHDQFSYLYDHGGHVVALIDRRSFHVDRGDELGLGEGGEEGSYVVHQVLPLERMAEIRELIVIQDLHRIFPAVYEAMVPL